MESEIPPEVVGHAVVLDEAEALSRLERDEYIGLDLETSGLSPFLDEIATVQMYGDQTGTLSLTHARGHISDNMCRFLEDPRRHFIVHNGVGFDMPFLRSAGVDILAGRWYDTLVGETVVVGSGRRDVSVSLRAAVKRRLGVDLDKGMQKSTWMAEELTPEQVAYATSDVVHLPALMRSQRERAVKSKQVPGLELEMELVPVFATMTANGMPLSVDKLNAYLELQDRRMVDIRPKFLEFFGEINPASPVQVKKAFHSKQIMVPNTLKETMMDLALHGGLPGEMAQTLLDYRAPAQRRKMYNPSWISENVVAGRVHSRFWQCSADTTRVTSSNPNLQQVPRDMREPWGWEPGIDIVAGDYSQIEVRIAAFLARDEILLEAITNEDVHSTIAAQTLGIPLSDVTAAQRKMAKAQTFTLLFGGGASTLYDYARLQGSSIGPEEARELVSKFFGRYGGLAAMRSRAEHLAETQSFVSIAQPYGAHGYAAANPEHVGAGDGGGRHQARDAGVQAARPRQVPVHSSSRRAGGGGAGGRVQGLRRGAGGSYGGWNALPRGLPREG
jgi:DNA polymerase-1